MRCGDETIPPPEIAIARDKSLAGFQCRLQARTIDRRDDTDVRKAVGQFGWRLDMPGQWFGPGRQTGIFAVTLDEPPMDGALR